METVAKKTIAILLMQVAISVIFSQSTAPNEESFLIGPEVSQLIDTLSSHRLYQEQLSSKEMTFSILSGILKGLDDRHSGVYKQYQYHWNSTSSSIETNDSGIILGKDEYDRLIALAVLFGSPAESAGIREGDFIYRIGSTNTAGVSIWELMPLLTGREGASVLIHTQRSDEELREILVRYYPFEIKTVSLEKGKISHMGWKRNEQGPIAWIRINSFLGETTMDEWDRCVESIQDSPTVQRLILDLRGNGGGDNSCIKLLGDFFRYADVLVRFENLLGEGATEIVFNKEQPRSRLMSYPLVVLVNQNTASLAEITAMALRDNRSIEIIGETSYGKGTTQTWLNLNEDFSIHLTLGKWFSPDGINIDGTGIIPDHVLEDDPRTREDEQLSKALEIIYEGL